MTSDRLQRQVFAPLPAPRRRPGKLRLLPPAMCVGMLAAIAGIGLGSLRREYRCRNMSRNAQRLLACDSASEARELLGILARQRTGCGNDPRVRISMALGYLRAAELLPLRRECLERALRELDALPPSRVEPLLRQLFLDLRSQVLLELGRDRDTLAAMRELAELRRRLAGTRPPLPAAELQRRNNLAYLLASARDAGVRDPERALRLAQEVVASDVRLQDGRRPSAVAAYLDTLAESYFACGRARRALLVQRSALCLARQPGLAVYLEHFDRYRRAATGNASARDEK